MKMKQLALTLTAAALVTWPSADALRAADDHDHDHDHAGHHHHGDEELAKLKGVPGDVPGAWKMLVEKTAVVEKAASEKKFDVIHHDEPYIRACLKVLSEKSTMIDTKNAKRLQGALKQAEKASLAAHVASDQKDAEGVLKNLKKLDGTLKLIHAQYPGNTLPPME